MRQVVLAGVLVAAAVVAFFVLRSGRDAGPLVGDGADERAADAPKAPGLASAGAPRDPRPERRPADGAGPGATTEREGDGADAPAITGIVVDAESGAPIAGATVLITSARTPCALLVDDRVLAPPAGSPTASASRWFHGARPDYAASSTVTLAEGRFASPPPDPRAPHADVLVRKPGYLVATACDVAPGVPVTVRLRRGLTLEGVVVDLKGAPVADVVVDAKPPRGEPPAPGRREAATSDAEGRFVVSGLVAGPLFVEATHDRYVADPLGPVEAGSKGLRIVVRPAFRVAFRVTTDNGIAPDTPTVEWTVPGAPPWRGVELVAENHDNDLPAEGEPARAAGVFVLGPVVVPAGRPTARFTLKAIGMEPWTSDAVDVPEGGGGTTLDVALRRDPDLGRAVVAVESRDGAPLSFVGERCTIAVGRRDGKAVDAGIVYRPGERLELPALLAGPWRFVVRSPRHAPATLDLDVVPGALAEGRVALGPPAKLRVRFTAPEATVVKFRLMLGREPAWPFVENALAGDGAPADETGGEEQVQTAGAEGALLSGLAAGRYTVELLSPELSAPPTAVDLVEGETREIEVSLTKR